MSNSRALWPNELYTARLHLRPFGVLDADALFALASDPHIGPACGWEPHNSPDESRQIIEQVLSEPYTFAVFATTKNHAFIGSVALKTSSSHPELYELGEHEFELGFWVGVPYQHQGFAAEAAQAAVRFAFNELGATRVVAITTPQNVASQRTQEAAGLTLAHATDQAQLRLADKHLWLESQPSVAGPFERTLQQQDAKRLLAHLPKISRLCSGGQTGADRAALDVARAQGLSCGGWCPEGGLAEDFPTAPGLLSTYPELQVAPGSDYVERTYLNVRDSNATLIVAPLGLEPQSGTEMTLKFARALERPCLVVSGPQQLAELMFWLSKLGYGLSLNVAGPRESKLPGTYRATYELLELLLEELKRQGQGFIGGGRE